MNPLTRPKLNNDRRRWLTALKPGDPVVMIEPRCFDDPSRAPINFEEVFVLVRQGKTLCVDGIMDDKTLGVLRFDSRGEWYCEGTTEEDGPDAWILPADAPQVCELRRVLATAHALAKITNSSLQECFNQLLAALAQDEDSPGRDEAEQLLDHAVSVTALARGFMVTRFVGS